MGGGHGMGGAAAPRAQFARSLADFVAVFPDRGGIAAFPTFGFKLKADDDGRPVVSIVFPDTLAESVGFATGDRVLDVNGVEMNDPSNPGRLFDFANLSVDNIERIEIMRGPGSTLYGSEAMGGVIHVITRRGTGTPSGSLAVEGGSYGTFAADYGLTHRQLAIVS